MEHFANAKAMIAARRPDRAVFGVRPHAAGRAARWFVEQFPGEVAYAYKANSSVFLIGALYGAGIRNFDVASLPELEDAATIPRAQLHFMHPVKSRTAIRRAYHEFGVRCFALDSEEELRKIVDETGAPKDLQLFVRLAVPAMNSGVPLERKFGIEEGQGASDLLVRARQYCDELGVMFHVGSQTTQVDSYDNAFGVVHRSIVSAGVVVDAIDVGGGFPARYGEDAPAPLQDFVDLIVRRFEELPVSTDCRLICEPGRALVAEAESLIVRVNARRGAELFVNDGAYGALFDAAQLGFAFPMRHIGEDGRPSSREMMDFSFWGPTCDSIDHMRGPFRLPADIREGDYIEIGNLGAYGRAISGQFNGYGRYEEVILEDEPMYSMYASNVHPLAQDG
ncbi:MAG: type III PLP-dependent enzyme [Hyphomicrobiaceae bacterium]|nr:type III PLP-dependent enzyme [Hyphomicrobiaceae bacterium]